MAQEIRWTKGQGGLFTGSQPGIGGKQAPALKRPKLAEEDRAELAKYHQYASARDAYSAITSGKLSDGVTLTTNEDQSFRDYVSGWQGGTKLNAALRQDKALTMHQQGIVEGVDKAMARSKLSEDTLLHRYVDQRFGMRELDNLQPGDIITDKGYVSTTAHDWGAALGVQDKIGRLKILAPAGSKVLIARHDLDLSEEHNEIVLDRNSRLEYLGDDEDGARVFRLSQLRAEIDKGIRAQISDQTTRSLEREVKQSIAQAEGEPLPGSEGHPGQISTRRITAKGHESDSENEYTRVEVEAMSPKQFAHDVALFKNGRFYPGMRPDEVSGPPQRVAKNVINRMTDNLVALYEATPKDIRARAEKWYPGAHKMIFDYAQENGVNEVSAVGALAVLSPQTEWYRNISLAQRTISIYAHQQDFQWDDAMDEVASKIWTNAQHKALAAEISGKKLSELAQPIDKAIWIRTYDQAHNDRRFRIYTPEGVAKGYVLNKDGTEATCGWTNNRDLAKAVMILEANGDRRIISKVIGNRHKVRSFNNNILDPYSPNNDATCDTHEIGAAWLYNSRQSDGAVLHGLDTNVDAAKVPKGFVGSTSSKETGVAGTYPFYADALRAAAKRVGIIPNALQAVTWTAKIGLFERRPDVQKAALKAWRDYRAGKISLKQTREQIFSHGMTKPDWMK